MGQPVLSVPKRITIVLVTWNSAPYLGRCLEGILQQTYRDRELIVVDNASTDPSAAIAEPHAARVIRNESNRGFSAAVNQALEVASGDFLLVVNPDCYLEPEYAERLVEVFESSSRQVAEDDSTTGPLDDSTTGPLDDSATRRLDDSTTRPLDDSATRPLDDSAIRRLDDSATRRLDDSTTRRLDDSATRRLDDSATRRLDDSTRIGSATGLLIRARGWDIEPTNVIDSMGIRMTRTGRHLDLHQGTPANRQPATASRFEVFGVSGAAAMYRVAFLRDVAIDGEALDEDFFAYREDADLAWRGQLRGWRAVCEPRAVAYHVRRVTPEARRKLPADVNLHSVKNRFLLRLKNEGAYLALRNAPFELARDLVVILAALTVERSSLPAFGWLWRNRGRVLARRRAIQSRRTVPDRELAKWFR